MAELELDRRRRLPLEPVQAALRALERLTGPSSSAEHRERRVAEEDEQAAGRSRRAASGSHLDGSHQIDAPYSETTRSNDGVREPVVLGVRLEELEPEPELRVHPPRGRELRGRQVDSDDARAPRRASHAPKYASAAAELDHVLPGDVRQHAHVRLRDADAPGDLLLRPCVARRASVYSAFACVPLARMRA